MTVLKIAERGNSGWGPEQSIISGLTAAGISGGSSSSTGPFTPPKPLTSVGNPEVWSAVVLESVENINRYPPTRLGRACDFSESNKARIQAQAIRFEAQQFNRNMRGNPIMQAQQAALLANKWEEDGYALVDTVRGVKRAKSKAVKPQYPMYNQPTTDYQIGILGAGKAGKKGAFGKGKGKGTGLLTMAAPLKGKGKGKKGFMKGKGKGKKGNRFGMQQGPLLDWSVKIQNEWEQLAEIGLNNMPKMVVDPKTMGVVKKDDLMWCGQTFAYDRSFDKISWRKPMRLKIADTVAFYNPPASEDEMLQVLMSQEKEAQVFATEQVLAAIMASSRSVYSWDVVITKMTTPDGEKLLIDKREGSNLDFYTVNETAGPELQPNPEDYTGLNGALKASQEATRINQNFSQAVIDGSVPPSSCDKDHPFWDADDGMAPSATAFRYRRITIPGNKKAADDSYSSQEVQIIVRTEVNAMQEGLSGEKGAVSAKCMNEIEFPDKKDKSEKGWKEQLGPNGKKGLVLATEIKNNSYKFARWIAQCWLSGAETLKLGFACRVSQDDSFHHDIVSVQSHQVANLADQSSFREPNAFGVLRHIIDTVRRAEDGKYLLIKDPQKASLRIYQVPMDSFEDDDDDEYDEEENEDDEDFVE